MSMFDGKMLRFRDILNPVILNAEWIGFFGDSEYQDDNGEWQMGYWSLVDVLEDTPTSNDWNLDDEVNEKIIRNGKWKFKIVNGKGHVCVVNFKYNPIEEKV